MRRLAIVNLFLRMSFRPLWALRLGAGPMRWIFGASDWLGALGRRLPQVSCEDIGGVALEWIGQPAHAARGMLMYVHGGAFAVRCARSDRLLCSDLAARSGLPVALLAYRLAPEHPYPAALDDCSALLQALLARGIPAERMVFVGHSAGANLIAAMLMRMRDAGLAQPAGAVLLSGCFDLTGPAPAALAMAGQDACATPHIWDWTRRHYLRGADAGHPHVSPCFGDWSALAPLQFQVSDSELLLDSVRASAARAQAAGVDVTLAVWPGLPHFYPALDILEGARLSRTAIIDFAARVLDRP